MTTTVILITGGALLILLLDWNHTGSLRDLKPGEKVMAAFFQSITTRTAGFETIPQKNFTDGSAMVSMILMFIGGSPMGTAGGVKTITVALLIVLVTSYIRGNHDTVVWGRKVVGRKYPLCGGDFLFCTDYCSYGHDPSGCRQWSSASGLCL